MGDLPLLAGNNTSLTVPPSQETCMCVCVRPWAMCGRYRLECDAL